jgi:ribokinase
VSVVVVGSLNMDYILQVPSLPRRGETVFAEGYSAAPGGKGANQAVASRRLGSHVHMVGCVGTDSPGQALVHYLQETGVDISGLKRDSSVSTGVAYITVAQDGANSIVVNRGANFALAPSHVLDVERLIQDANVVVVQLETPLESVSQALKLAKKHGTVTVLNPAPMVPLEPEMLSLSDWLIPNETEAISLLRLLNKWDEKGQDGLSEDLDLESARDAARKLAELTGAHVVITLGDKGCVYVGSFNPLGLVFPAWEVTAVDTTAAGDAFVGAIASALDEGLGQGQDITKLINFAQATAAIATTRPGAQPSLPTRDEVERFLMERQG